MKKINLLLASAVLMMASCSPKNQGEDAEVSEAKEVQEVATEAVNYVVDAATSTTNWIGSKPAGKHTGTIGISEGTISVEGDQIIGGNVVIDMNNIVCTDIPAEEEMNADLVGHLKSPDFFDVANNPTAEFVITSVEAYNSSDSVEVKEEFDTEFKPAAADEYMVENPTHKITGNLTMRGTTLSIAFPAKVTMTDGNISATAKFNIDRTLWGVMYGDEASAADKAKDKFIYNTVNVGFDLNAAKEAEAQM